MKDEAAPKDRILTMTEDGQVLLPLGLKYNLFLQKLSCGNHPGVPVRHRELQCILVLAYAHPYGVLRETFLREIWGSQNRKTKSLDMHIFKLRQKLQSLGFELLYRSERFLIKERWDAQAKIEGKPLATKIR